MPATIGHKVSGGCIRMLNADMVDLYSRVDVGTKIVVLPNHSTVAAIAAPDLSRAAAPHTRQVTASNIY